MPWVVEIRKMYDFNLLIILHWHEGKESEMPHRGTANQSPAESETIHTSECSYDVQVYKYRIQTSEQHSAQKKILKC